MFDESGFVVYSDLCRNQAGDSLNMELFDRIVQIEKDKDYGFNQQMHEIMERPVFK